MPRKKPDRAPVSKRRDGELYLRPYPNPFSENWLDGYKTALDGGVHRDSPDSDMEWRDGFSTGLDQLEFDRADLDRMGSSNA